MKSKTTKVRRYLAAILTVLMIFQQATTSVIYASSEAAVPTVTEAPAAQTEETSEKQVEETPEEKTPTEGENEGEESAAPTEAPAENEAAPEVTVTPAAEPTATEAPAVEATATPVPEATEVPEATPIPEVTETPEETPKTDFTYEDSRVAITAKAEEGANLPQDAELKADYIDPNSDVYKAAVEAFNVQLGNDDTVADYVLYDIYFLSASKEGRIEPEDGNVTVNVTFKTQQETENKGEILESQVVHLDDQNNAEVVSGNVDISSDGTVQSMTFTNNSFSPYGFRLAYAKQATPTVKSNEYYMTLEDAKKTTVKLGMADDIRNAIQNFKIEIQCTYYDEAQNELNGINPDKFRDIQIGSMSGGRYLGNDFQNVDSRVAYVKITMLENELKNTFFTFGKNAPVKNGNDITFNIETRTFQPDEVWEANGLTYIAVGPEHQYNVSGPLGLINNFHAVGFTKVHNSVHTNGNILTKELTYGSNFGTNQVSNEISYIESFTSINGGMQCGADNNDILVIGKDIKVTCDGQHFYLNGHKLDRPKIVYQDTQDYKFLDVSGLKTEAVQLSTDMAGQPDQGVTKSEGKLIISEGYSGTAVCNITLEELQSHSQIEGLSNNSGTSLILNIKVSGDSVTIPQLSLNNVNNTGGEQGDFSAGKLIWNILNQDGTPYTGSVYQDKATTGTILVPNGTFTTGANWNGSMIANVVNINAESHRTDFTGTMGFGVEKLVEKDKRDAWQNNYKFQFELSAANGTPMPKGSKENSEENLAKVIEASYGNRTPSFGLITYSQSDIGKTYEYTLKELVGNVSGISYSKVVYKIKVEIQSNEGVGLSIIRSYSSDGGKTWTAGLPKGDRFTFTNTFNNEKGSLTIIKNVTGENDDFAGTFYFTVTQGNKYSSYKYYDLNGNASSSKKVLALEYANKAGSITLNNLPVGTYEVTEVADAKGTAIKNATKFPYTVSKIKGSVEVVAGNAVEYTVTNSKGELKVSATVKKVWYDENNRDGKRPENLKVELKKGEIVVKEVTLNAGNNWTATVTGLKEKEDGQTINYTWSEKDLPEGYSLTRTDKEGSITTLTNTYFIKTTKVEGTKTWSDSGNQDGRRPSSITVNLLANGKQIANKTVTEADNWKYSFTNLPKYENGKEIVYTVTEESVENYSTTINGYNITNSYTPGKTSVTVTKAWVDNDNKDNKRPSDIKVQLYADGQKSGSPVTLNEANKWTYTWTGLDEKNGGTAIAYTVKEVNTVDGYEASVSGDARTGYTITNTLKSGTLEIVKSIIGDVSDSALTAEQKAAMTFTVTGPDGYSETVHYSDFADGKYTFQNLPLGEYTVTETKESAEIVGYDLTTTYSVDGGKVNVKNKETSKVTVTNNYTTITVNVNGAKTWSGDDSQKDSRPDSITVNLLANGKQVASKTVTEADNWKYSFTNLPKYENGKEIVYTVTEESVENYSTTINDYNITNSYTPGKTSVTVTKAWVDNDNKGNKRPSEIKVQLYAGEQTSGSPVTLNEANKWTYTWTGLDEKKGGTTIAYTVKEIGTVDGYEASVSGDARTGYTITNTLKSGTLEIVKSITGDVSDSALTAEQKAAMTFTVTGPDGYSETVHYSDFANGKYIFQNLPLGEYTVTETNADMEGYKLTTTYSVDGGKVNVTNKETATITITNDYTKTKDILVKISKVDSDTYEVLGGAHLQVIGPDNKVVAEWDSDKDVHTLTGLTPGVIYTLHETAAPKGYEVAKDTTFQLNEDGTFNTEGTTATIKDGTLLVKDKKVIEEKIDISGTKTWSDGGNQDGSRPSSITVNLLANGTKVASKEVTAKDNWKYSFTDLPKYENGTAINYTVTEDAVAGYSTTINGYDITNSYTPGQTSVTVTKAWVDNDNKGNKRPSEIKVQLYADGRESGSPVTLNEANKWTYTWTGLDEKNGGTTIAYTVKEVGTVDGYEASVSGDARTGYTITNTLKSGTLEIVKSITGDVSDSALTAEQKAAMTFTVTGPDGYSETVHYSDFVNGKYTFQNLPLGEYTVIETNADMEGYKLTTTYSVDGGKVTVTNKETATITITNDYTKTKDVSVKISKVDADTYEVLGGAHLQVIDPDGKVVAEWDSDKDAYTLTDLKPGVVYTLHETAAPKGYKVAEDTTFQLNEDGTIDTTNTTTAISDDTLLVKDEKKESKDVSVSVTKKLVTVDGTVIGAVDATYYVALYSDADCTERVSDVLALNFKNASSSTVTFTGLEKGQTYYVGECEADGTCYLANICADGTMYMVDFSDGNAVTVDNSDGSTTVYFDNQFENIPDGYYKEAELNITKKLVGSDGKAKNSNEIFYAGIFADEGFTQLSTDVSQNIVPLDLAGGSEATALVNVALPESGSITLYVTEVDSNGKPVAGAASFKYDVTVDNAQVTLNDDNLSANVVITNTENSTKVTPTPGTPNTPNTTGGFSGKSAVRTGDSTPIGGFIALFAAAAVIAGAAVFFKRRRKDEK